jgi:hypothetical protein
VVRVKRLRRDAAAVVAHGDHQPVGTVVFSDLEGDPGSTGLDGVLHDVQ